MKRIIALCIAAALVFVLSACGDTLIEPANNLPTTSEILPPSDTLPPEALDGPDDVSLDKPDLNGVSIRTELGIYTSDTARILVYWENHGDQSLTFGEGWHLEKYKSNGWVAVKPSNDLVFNSIGYMLNPNEVRKHVYWLTYNYGPLDEGVYRIATSYFNNKDIPIGADDHYSLYAVFTVSNEDTNTKQSELDYDDLENSKDITPGDVEQSSSIRIYKHKNTFDTTVVIDGETYEIASGDGRWGVIQINWYCADGSEYLVYAYSRDCEGEKIARIAVFDVEAREDVFVSREFHEMDLCVGPTPLSGTEFTVWRAAHEEDEFGGYSGAIYEDLATLKYENGAFAMQPIVAE